MRKLCHKLFGALGRGKLFLPYYLCKRLNGAGALGGAPGAQAAAIAVWGQYVPVCFSVWHILYKNRRRGGELRSHCKISDNIVRAIIIFGVEVA